MKNKSRFILPILTFLTFGMVTGSIVAVDHIKDDKAVEEADAAISGTTLYFENYWNYSEPHVHYWGGSSESTWPGPKMTDTTLDFDWDSNKRDIYYVTVAEGTTTVKFSDNGDNGDGDYTISNGANMMIQRSHKWVYWDGVTDCWRGQMRTIYFARKGWEYWTTNYVHSWNVGQDGSTWGSDPSMTSVGEYVVDEETHYLSSLEVPAYCCDFIFKNAPGDTDKRVQNSLALDATKTVYDGDAGEWKALITYDSNKPTGSTSFEVHDTGANLSSVESLGFTPPSSHHHFKEWNTEKDGSGKSYSETEAYSDGNVTLYAIWEENVYTISLSEGDPTTSGTPAIYEKYNVGFFLDEDCTKRMTSSTNPITKPIKTNYVFKGYYSSSGGIGLTIIDENGYINESLAYNTFTGSTSVFSYWIGYPCAVTFNQQGGDGGVTATPTFNYNSEIINYHGAYSAPTLLGHTFLGYFDDPEGGKQYYYSDLSRKTVVWDKAQDTCTLYAHYSVGVYTITFDKQEGTGGTDSVNVTFGSAIPDISVPHKDGCVFDGYYDASIGGTKYIDSDGKSVRNWDKESYTLHAHWTVITITKGFIVGNTMGVQYQIPVAYNSLYDTVQITAPNPAYSYVSNVTKTYTPTTTPASDDYKIVNLAVNACHFTAPITFKLLKGETEIYTETLTVRQMTASIASTGTFDKDVKNQANIIKSALTYASYSQLYFGVNTSNLANGDISSTNKVNIVSALNTTAIPTSTTLDPVITGEPNISVNTVAFGSSAGFVLRFGLNYTDDISNYEVSLTSAPVGLSASIIYDELHTRYVVDVTGIGAEYLRTTLTIKLTNTKTGGTYSLNFSVGTYCSIVDRTPSIKQDTSLYNLVKAVNLIAAIESL